MLLLSAAVVVQMSGRLYGAAVRNENADQPTIEYVQQKRATRVWRQILWKLLLLNYYLKQVRLLLLSLLLSLLYVT